MLLSRGEVGASFAYGGTELGTLNCCFEALVSMAIKHIPYCLKPLNSFGSDEATATSFSVSLTTTKR